MSEEQLEALKAWVRAVVNQRVQAATGGSASRREMEECEELLDEVMLKRSDSVGGV